MKKTEYNLNAQYDKIAEFVKNNIKKYSEITELAQLKEGSTLIIAKATKGEKEVIIRILDTIKNDKTLVLKETKMSSITEEWTPKKLEGIFMIEETNLYKGNFENTDNKKELVAYIKTINLTVNPTTPVARIFFSSKEASETKKAKEVIKAIEDELKSKYDIDCQSRYSEGAGKVIGGTYASMGGINISAKNAIPSVYTVLHQKDAYWHKHNKMCLYVYDEATEVANFIEASEEHIAMLKEYKDAKAAYEAATRKETIA